MRKSSAKTPADPASQTHLVVENGLQFIERGVAELWATKKKDNLKHSVINFYSGVELLLKARLMMEHWSLIISDIRSADQETFLKGDFHSVGLQDIRSRLQKVAGVSIPPDARDAFNVLRNHRNKMVHFYHEVDLRTKQGSETKSNIVKEQCNGWFYLRRLISEDWNDEFANYQARIRRINSSMKRHREYLRHVYSKVKPDLRKAEKEGAILGHCYSCGFDAHILDEPGPQETRCKVCNNYSSFLTYQCDDEDCKTLILIDQGEEDFACPKCDAEYTIAEVMEAFTEEGHMPPDEALIDGGYGHCYECSGYQTVGTIDDENSFCFSCHQFHPPMGQCEFCGSKSTGDLEMSYMLGCAACDGKAGWDGDKD